MVSTTFHQLVDYIDDILSAAIRSSAIFAVQRHMTAEYEKCWKFQSTRERSLWLKSEDVIEQSCHIILNGVFRNALSLVKKHFIFKDGI